MYAHFDASKNACNVVNELNRVLCFRCPFLRLGLGLISLETHLEETLFI